MLHELRKAPHIPGETLPERRMEEALEREIDARQRIAETFKERCVRGAACEQVPRKIAHQAGRVAAPSRPLIVPISPPSAVGKMRGTGSEGSCSARCSSTRS